MGSFRSLWQSLLLLSLLTGPCPVNAQQRIQVTVTGPNDARPNVTLYVFDRDGKRRLTLPSERAIDGVFTFALQDTDSKLVACDGSGYVPKAYNLKAPDGISSNMVILTLYPPSTTAQIKGHVQDRTSKPVGKAEVSIHFSDKIFGCIWPALRANSNIQGDYMIAGLPVTEGLTYQVFATSKNLPLSNPPTPRKPQLRSGDIGIIDFTLSGEGTQQAGVSSGAGATSSVAGGGINGYRTRVSTALSFEATYTHRIFAARRAQLNLEFPLMIRPAATIQSDTLAVVKDYRALFFTPSLRLTFMLHRRSYPWVSLGSGLGHFVPSALDQVLQSAFVRGAAASSTSKVAFQGGAGVDFWPLPHLGFRTQVRNYYSGRPNLGIGIPDINLRNNLFFGGGLLIR